MAQVLASAAFRGDVLFIHFSSPETLLGALYSIDTNSNHSPWSSRVAPPSSNRGVGSTVPFFYYFKQHISPSPGRNLNNSLKSPTALSMVSTSSSDPDSKAVRHDLLITVRSAQLGSSPMVRLVPMAPNDGTADPKGSISWWAMTEDEDSVLSPTNSSQLWIASGAPSALSGKQEGSIIYRLATGSGAGVVVQTIDVFKKNTSAGAGSNLLGTLSISSVNSSMTPKVLWLRGSGPYDAVVVGQCATISRGTCLVFFNDKSQITITTTAFEYDPDACLVANNGVIIMATSTQMWTFKYSAESLASRNGSWSMRSIKGLKSRSILACTAKGSTVFAVVEGLPFIPSLKTLDFGSSTDLSWETMEILDGWSDNYGHGPGMADASSERGLSSKTLALIIVVILAVTVTAGICWRRRSRLKAFRLKMSDAAADLPQSTSRQPPEAPTHSIPLQPVNRSAQHVVVPGLGSGTEARSAPGSGSGSGSGSGPGVPRAHSWSQSTSMGPTSASAALYTQRASFPYPATSSAGEFYSRPGQQLPIIATSLSAAPYKPFVISSSPIITPNGSPNRSSDKDELDQDAEAQDVTSSEAESSAHSNAVASTSGTYPNEGSSSAAGPSTTSHNTFYPQSAGESSRSYRNSRPMHEMMSPTLANAQRILQQSQEHQQPRYT